ncbi:MAG: diguanylate cyclase [Selenomonas montiformis]|nr:diguanylate cyclase [Selenomonas montiformis]
MRRSIKTKILMLCLSAMAALAIALGGVSVLSINRLTGQHEAENMNRIAEIHRETINQHLIQTEDIAHFVAGSVGSRVKNPLYIQDQVVRRQLCRDIQETFTDAIGEDTTVCAYYLYYAEDLAGTKDNLYMVRERESDSFSAKERKPVSSYAASETEQAKWYREPVKEGRAVWLDPHYSEEQQRYLISYVVPVFKDDTLIAVVGVDLDFEKMMQWFSDIRIYSSGFCYLSNLSGTIHYRADIPGGISADHNGRMKLSTGQLWVPNTDSHELVRYRLDGREYDVASSMLRNNMAFMVIAPVQEIYEQAYLNIAQMVLLFLLILGIFAVISYKITQRMTRHLNHITEAAHAIADGSFDIHLPETGNDEIGELSRALNHTTRELKESIQEMERMTFQDALTGLYNRLGIDRYTKEWIEAHPESPAVLMSLDLDDFKFINDLYGHSVGDAALRSLANSLLESFGQNGILGRNGGDEFVVLLTNTRESEATDQIRSFMKKSKGFWVNGEEKTFTISVGYASYPKPAETRNMLFHQADEALYAVKLKGKNNFGPYRADQETLNRSHLGFNLKDIGRYLPGAILVYKAEEEGRILFASDELVRMTGCRDMDEFMEFTGGSFGGLVAEADSGRMGAFIQKQLSQEGSSEYARYHIRCRQEPYVAVASRGRLVRNPIYGMVFYVSILEDNGQWNGEKNGDGNNE